MVFQKNNKSNSRTKTIIFLVILLILIGIGIGIYYFIYEVPNPEIVNNMVNDRLLKIKALYEDKFVIINLSVITNESVYNLITRNDSYEEIKIPIKYNTINVKPVYNNVYYSDENYFIGNPSILTIKLNKIGDLTVEQIGNFTVGNGNININITTNITNRELHICVRWSVNVIEVVNKQYSRVNLLNTKLDCENANYKWIDVKIDCNILCKWGFKEKNITKAYCENPYVELLPPNRLKNNIDRCWVVKKTITKEDGLIFSLDYRTYENLNENDFIKVYIIDSDKNLENNYRLEDEKGNDIGSKDFIYIIKK